MGKRAKQGTVPASVAKTTADASAKVTKKAPRGRKDKPIKAVVEKKRNNVKKRTATKQPKAEKIQKVVTHLRKQASIQALAKDRRVLTKAQTEKREADRKRHVQRIHRKMDAEGLVKKAQLQKQKAILAKRAALVSGIKKQQKKVRTSPYFRRPKSLELKSVPKYPKKSVPSKPELNQYSIIQHPHVTESAMRAIENHHTLVFIVDVRSNKRQIKEACTKLYNVKPVKVNTLIRPDGKKKAFVKLGKDVDALDVANRIGII